MIIRFTIPGVPQGKQRPRFTRFGHTYTPEKTRQYEEDVRSAYLEAARDAHFSDRPVCVEILAFYPIPKSAAKGRRAAMADGSIRPVVKPDCDNVCKIICDALNGIAWRDDAQVVKITVEKRYGETPMVHVVIDG